MTTPNPLTPRRFAYERDLPNTPSFEDMLNAMQTYVEHHRDCQALAQQSQWRPIETAPAARMILVWADAHYLVCAWHTQEKGHCWAYYTPDGMPVGILDVSPTHLALLPPAPHGQQEGQA